MRHKIKGTKLNRNSSHRRAMLRNMATSLIINEQIKTTVAKAKMLRPYVEQLVTKARKGTLSARRDVMSHIRDKQAAGKIMSALADRYKNRPGGYTRVSKAGFRYGDKAPVAYIEFVDRDMNAKGSATPKIDKQEQEIQE